MEWTCFGGGQCSYLEETLVEVRLLGDTLGHGSSLVLGLGLGTFG